MSRGIASCDAGSIRVLGHPGPRTLGDMHNTGGLVHVAWHRLLRCRQYLAGSGLLTLQLGIEAVTNFRVLCSRERGVLHTQCPREDLNLHPVTWTRT